MLIEHEESILISSNPALGALNVDSNGSGFEINIPHGVTIPKDAFNVQVGVAEATIWFVIPNIKTNVNDKLYLTSLNHAPEHITIPQGLYDLSQLNQAIQKELKLTTNYVNAITLVGNASTQKVELILATDVYVDFTQADTFRDRLGFESDLYQTTTIAPNVAQMTPINKFLIHSDITNQGILINNKYSRMIGQVLIDVAPSSQIIYRPTNYAKSDCNNLRGHHLDHLKFWLSDENNVRVDTNTEYWTARIVISYYLPYHALN